MWLGRVSNQRPLDSQSDSLPNTNTKYRIETKTMYARLQHSFYTIRKETETKKLTNIEYYLHRCANKDSKLLRKQWTVLCATKRIEVSQTLISKYYGNTKE